VDRVFIRDSSRESNELIRLKGEFERSCEQERRGGGCVCLLCQVVSELDSCLYISDGEA
jgi:hypothetical protein